MSSQSQPGNICCAERSSSRGQEALPSRELQEVVWKQSFTNTMQWYSRHSKPTFQQPDFIQESKLLLWLDDRHIVSLMGAGFKPIAEAVRISAQGRVHSASTEGCLEDGICRKLCEDGLTSDAVDALDLLVQRGSNVPSSLFYRVLKRCIQDKDLVLGRRIHALTVESGYEGDAFLATHLIGLYASHGRLEDAMGVFSKVLTPDAYNWTTIIFAYARHGDAAQAAKAILLYRQMWKSAAIKPDNRLYSAVLKACAAAKDFAAGKEVHGHILARSAGPDTFLQAGLVDMYAKCCSLEDARKVFNEIVVKNAVTWTVMIAGYAQQGMGQEALDLYRNMKKDGQTPTRVTYACLLQACASVGALHDGKQLHAEIKQRGMQEDLVLGGSLINMYAKCGNVAEARSVFERLSKRNLVAWNAMISGYAQQGRGLEALDLYSRMEQDGLSADRFTYVSLLQACASLGEGALDAGKQLHAELKERMLQEDVVVGGSLVNMYAKCGGLVDARGLFDKLPERNLVAWNAMIAGYALQGMGHEALDLYSSMRQESLTPDRFTYASLLQACANVGVGALCEGKQFHAQIKALGLEQVLGSSLVNMHAKCGNLEDARSVFERLAERSLVSWNAMIAGYAQQGMGQESLSLYRSMQQQGLTLNSVTYVCLLQACGEVGAEAVREGKQIHAQIKQLGLEKDVVLGGSLVDMYVKWGRLEEARVLFDEHANKDVVTWNVMIAGYAQQGIGREALSLYSSMRREGLSPNSFTYVSLLQACASLGSKAFEEAEHLHTEIKERGLQGDAVLGGSLVNMYVKCGSLEDARFLFDNLVEKNPVAWNAMISGYAEQGLPQEALTLYSCMQQEGLAPDYVTYICLLQACEVVGALSLGEQLHAEIKKKGMQADGIVGTALVNMYAKCGSMSHSQQVFDLLSARRIEAWGALISGYARQGESQVVFDLFEKMRLEGVRPNEITFLGVLTMCSHAGLVDRGREYFRIMRKDHGIIGAMEHYICMVDLLGRAGLLDEALQMTRTMPFPPNGTVWYALLGACCKWKNVKIGQQAFQGAISVDEKGAAPYVLMSNIYASSHMWEEARHMQARRRELGALKTQGQTWWTDMSGKVHAFFVGDGKHP